MPNPPTPRVTHQEARRAVEANECDEHGADVEASNFNVLRLYILQQEALDSAGHSQPDMPKLGEPVLTRRSNTWRVERLMLGRSWNFDGVATSEDPDEWRELPTVPHG